jgi:hypothetical protein
MKISFVGKKINQLTILEHVSYRRVKVKCDCGKEKECDFYDLKRNKIKSCGCAKNTPELRELARKRAYKLIEIGAFNRGGDLHSKEFRDFKYIFKCIKNKNRKSSNITLEDLKDCWDKQHGKCAYTNTLLILPTHKNHKLEVPNWRVASVDRIDSNLGYIKDNIQFVSRTINYAKHTMKHDDMINFINFIKNIG